ncbi:MAG: VOC family protein [Deltaproteobacteria bacterium]|nr:VOC family protein [Deltaproteobacteria bacterium]
METVQGIGGVFFAARGDKEALLAWYRDVLGVPIASWGGHAFPWAEQAAAADATTTFSVFGADSTYFAPGTATFMINFRVEDLDAMLAQARAAGANVVDRIEDSDFGRFGWVIDPEGNKVELWQPPAGGEPAG